MIIPTKVKFLKAIKDRVIMIQKEMQLQFQGILVSALGERESYGFDRFTPFKISPTAAAHWCG